MKYIYIYILILQTVATCVVRKFYYTKIQNYDR